METKKNEKLFPSSIPALSANNHFISTQSNERNGSIVSSGSLRIESLSAYSKAGELKFGKLTNRQLPQNTLKDSNIKA
jgi:hypothetical protein